MLAASYWSLLAPAIELAEQSGIYGPFIFLPVSLGFTAGSVFVYMSDVLLPLLVCFLFSIGLYFIFGHLNFQQYQSCPLVVGTA